MRRMLLPVIVSLCLYGTGCTLLTQAMPGVSAVPAGDYLPLKAGAIWVMRRVGKTPSDFTGDDGIGTITVSITNTEAFSHSLKAVLEATTRDLAVSGQTIVAASYVDTQKSLTVVKRDTGEVLLPPGSAPGQVDRLRFLYPLGRSSTIAETPYMRLPTALGEVVLAPAERFVSGTTTYQFDAIRQVSVREPDVTVAAGRFSDCLKLVVTTRYTEETSAPAQRFSRAITTTYWLAKGVGIIRKEHTFLEPAIVPGSVAEELATYSIPQ